jgi:hypothetical protein
MILSLSEPRPNKLAAPNPAIASQFQVKRHWRGIGEPERSPVKVVYAYGIFL